MIAIATCKAACCAAVMRDGAIIYIRAANLAIIGVTVVTCISTNATACTSRRTIVWCAASRSVFPCTIGACSGRRATAAFGIVHAAAAICASTVA